MSSVEYQPPHSALPPLDTASQDFLEAQEPVFVYQTPSYNYHFPADLERSSARCGLFEDQANAYATSSSEASPCLATPQTLHPTQTFGHPPHTYSPLEQMQFVESLNNAFSVAALKPDVSTYENTYPLPFPTPNGTMSYYSDTAPFTVRPYSPTFTTSACVPYPGGFMQPPQYVHQPHEVPSNVQYPLPGQSYLVQPIPINGHQSIIAPAPRPSPWPRSPPIAQRLEHAAKNADHQIPFEFQDAKAGDHQIPFKFPDAEAGDHDGPKKNRKKPPALSCYFCRHRKIRCCEISQPGEEKRCNQCERRRRKCEYPPETTRTDRRRTRKATLDAQRV